MTELKYGGSDVKIMYGDREIGGAAKLEPGTIVYMSKTGEIGLENIHLLSTTKNWSNLNSINIQTLDEASHDDVDIPVDDFESLDIEKKYPFNISTITVSRSIVDGEYRLNVSFGKYPSHFLISAI